MDGDGLELEGLSGRKRSVEESTLKPVDWELSTDSVQHSKESASKRVCLRVVENLIKPDTPMIPNIKSRLQAITDRYVDSDENIDSDAATRQRLSLTDDDKVKTQLLKCNPVNRDELSDKKSKESLGHWSEVCGRVELTTATGFDGKISSKHVDPTLQSVSERMAGWQKKIDSSATSTVMRVVAKGSPIRDCRSSSLERSTVDADECQSVRSRFSMWQQKVSMEQSGSTSVVLPQKITSECCLSDIEDKSSNKTVTVEASSNEPVLQITIGSSSENSNLELLVSTPTPVPRTSIYSLLKKPSSGSTQAPAASKLSVLEEAGLNSDGRTTKPTDKQIIDESAIDESNENVSDYGISNKVEESIVSSSLDQIVDSPRVETLECKDTEELHPEKEEAAATDMLDEVLDDFGSPSIKKDDIVEQVPSNMKSEVLADSDDIFSVASIDISIPVFQAVKALTEKESDLEYDPSILRRRDVPEDEYTSIKQYRQQVARPMSCSNVLDDKLDVSMSFNKRATCIGEYGNSKKLDETDRIQGTSERLLGTKSRLEKSPEEQIKVLEDMILQEQSIMNQANNALKQCSISAFAGSLEMVECHRLLLTAGKKQEVYLNEISRLKAKNADRNLSATSARGHLKLTDLRIPLKQDFISKRNNGEDIAVHHFIVVIRCGSKVYCTPTISSHDITVRDSIEVTGSFQFQDIRQNFELHMELYSMPILPEPQTPKKKKVPTATLC